MLKQLSYTFYLQQLYNFLVHFTEEAEALKAPKSRAKVPKMPLHHMKKVSVVEVLLNIDVRKGEVDEEEVDSLIVTAVTLLFEDHARDVTHTLAYYSTMRC